MTTTIVSPSVLDRSAPQQQKLYLDSLMVDHEVQRSIDPVWIRKELEKGFKRNALGVIVVSARADNTFHVIDGQHRTELCRQFKYNQPLDCLVYRGLSKAEEALMFLVLNNRRAVQPIDRFRVRVLQGDESAVAIDGLLKKYGFILRNSKVPNSFSAISALEKVYTGWGRVPAKNLGVCASVLSVIRGAWDSDSNGAHSAIVTGLGLIFIRYGSRIDMAKLISELSATQGGPRALWGRARALKDLTGGRIGDAMATQLINMLNRHRRGDKNKLPSWMETEGE